MNAMFHVANSSQLIITVSHMKPFRRSMQKIWSPNVTSCSLVRDKAVSEKHATSIFTAETGRPQTVKVKVKWPRYRPGCGPEGGRGIALLFQDLGARRGWVVSSTPRPHFTPGKDPVPFVQEAGWTPGPVWTGGKSRLHRHSIPRTVQPVVSRYTDWATRPTTTDGTSKKKKWQLSRPHHRIPQWLLCLN